LHHQATLTTAETESARARIRILISEDHLIARAGMGAIVSAQPDMLVIGEAINGQEAVLLFRQHRPDVTLMDMRMPVMNGCEAVQAICSEFPEARIIALSTFGGDEDIRRALLMGARSFLTKDAAQDELIGAIRAVHGGEQYLPPSVLATLAADASDPNLSARELEVLQLMAHGMSNKEIAYELSIAEDTAKNHVKSILKKLGAHDRTKAATEAIQRGIIHLHR
jgi:two-component system, NarL family, response regulator